MCWLRTLRKRMFPLVLLIPTWAYGADSNVATVQALGKAWLNGVPIPRMSALFQGDEIQTRTDLADIDAFGSKVLVLTDSLVTYQSSAVDVERGGISVATSKGVAARLGDLVIRPATADWTEFQVVEINGEARIRATKGELALVDENGTSSLSAGQETTREVKHKRKKRAAGAPPTATGSVLDSKLALILGGTTIAGIVIPYVILQDDDPISPDGP
jgi:hypothetical protein